jgi:hypothetical protein
MAAAASVAGASCAAAPPATVASNAMTSRRRMPNCVAASGASMSRCGLYRHMVVTRPGASSFLNAFSINAGTGETRHQMVHHRRGQRLGPGEREHFKIVWQGERAMEAGPQQLGLQVRIAIGEAACRLPLPQRVPQQAMHVQLIKRSHLRLRH